MNINKSQTNFVLKDKDDRNEGTVQFFVRTRWQYIFSVLYVFLNSHDYADIILKLHIKRILKVRHTPRWWWISERNFGSRTNIGNWKQFRYYSLELTMTHIKYAQTTSRLFLLSKKKMWNVKLSHITHCSNNNDINILCEIFLSEFKRLRGPLRNRSLPTASDNVISCKMFYIIFHLLNHNRKQWNYYDFILFYLKIFYNTQLEIYKKKHCIQKERNKKKMISI